MALFNAAPILLKHFQRVARFQAASVREHGGIHGDSLAARELTRSADCDANADGLHIGGGAATL
eukprot:6362879-Pyramimonas_sp.AAC.1